MHLNTKLRILEHADHLSHTLTLWLVAASLAALLLGNLFPEAQKAETALSAILHFVHWFALAVVIAYHLARLFLERNVGRELALLIKDAETEEVTGTPPGKPNRANRSNTLVITKQDVEFVSSSSGALATLLNNFNMEGFERSIAFGMTQEEVIRRNTDIINRCPKAFSLVRAGPTSPRDVFIGYTCVLPLNEVGTDIYLRGLIKDKYITASMLCRTGESVNAILIFAIVLDQKITKSKTLKGKSFGFLLKALEYHVSVVAEEYAPGSGPVDVWVQSEDDALQTLLLSRGFKATNPRTMSANRHELLRLRFYPKAAAVQPAQKSEQPDTSDTDPLTPEMTVKPQSAPHVADAEQRKGKEPKQDSPVEKALTEDKH